MKHMNIFGRVALISTLAALASLSLSGCVKDNAGETGIKLVAEKHHNGAKTSVDGANVYWVNGDMVNINGKEYEINYNAGSVANVLVTDIEHSDLLAFYPADKLVGSMTASEVTLSLPSVYIYDEADGRQVIPFPMAAKGQMEENGELHFKHLCAGVQVTVKNSTGNPLLLGAVTLSSTTSQLSGTRAVSLSGLNESGFAVAPTEATSDAQKSVSLRFSKEGMLLAANESHTFQLPVFPIASGDELRFVIVAGERKIPGVIVTDSYTYDHGGVHTSVQIDRAQVIATPTIEITPDDTENITHVGTKFTISASGQQVYFAQGDLQYEISSSRFLFSNNQHATIGADNVGGNIIDLFCYGSSGNIIPPTATNTNYNTNSVKGSISKTENDWGWHNSIDCRNGVMTGTHKWYTMTFDQWKYLLRSRSTNNTIGGVSNARYAYCIVDGSYGILIFPDNFSMPAISKDYSTWNTVNIINYSSDGTKYTPFDITDDWSILEAAGCAFMVADGWVNASGKHSEPHNAIYWAGDVATSGKEKDRGYSVFFNNLGLATNDPDSRPPTTSGPNGLWSKDRKGRLAVRLVRDVETTD